MARLKNFVYAGGLALMALGFAIGPIMLQRSQTNLTTKKDGLTGSQIMRGAYANTGSKDVGVDPDWQDGRYVGKSARNFEPSPEEVAAARARFEALMARKSGKSTGDGAASA